MKCIHLQRNSYVVKLMRQGNTLQKSFSFYNNEKSKREVLKLARDYRDKQLQSYEKYGCFIDENSSLMTFKEVLELYEKDVVSKLKSETQTKHTVKQIIAYAKKLKFSERAINSITNEHYKDLKNYMLEEEYAASTINTYLSVIRSALKHVRQERNFNDLQLPTDLFLSVNNRKTVTTNKDTLQAILAMLDSKKTVAGIELLFETGGRRSEITFLKCEQVDFNNKLIHLETSKNNEPVSLFLSTRAIEILKGLITEESSGYVFSDDGGKTHYHKDTFTRAFIRARDRLAIKENDDSIRQINLHALRHSFVSRIVQRVENVHVQKKLSHHADLRSLERYVHQDNVRLRKKLDTVLDAAEE